MTLRLCVPAPTNRLLLAAALISIGGIWLIMAFGQGTGVQISDMSLTLRDQLERTSPYFIANGNSTKELKATFALQVSEGSLMPFPGATFTWITPNGDSSVQVYRSFVYAGSNRFIAECVLDVDLSDFPPRIGAYTVTAAAGEHHMSLEFHICGRPMSTIYAEDFSDRRPGSMPDDWHIEEEGYGPGAHWIEDLIFEGHDRVLRSASYFDREALLLRPINVSSQHLAIDFRTRISEGRVANNSKQDAFALGLQADHGRSPLFELGRSDMQKVLPFGIPYQQDTWLDVEIYVDLVGDGSEATAYINGRLAGRASLPPLLAEDVVGLYFRLGGGAHYVCHIDDICIDEYDLDQGHSGRPANASLTVSPSDGQWLDPNGLLVTYEVEVTPCLPSNPYIVVNEVVLELWNETHRLGVVGRTSWNGTTCTSPCTVVEHRYVRRIPADLISNPSLGHREYEGLYTVKAVPSDPRLELLECTFEFKVDDPMDSYFSTTKAGLPLCPPDFEARDVNVTLNIEFDPLPAYVNASDPFVDKGVKIAWLSPQGELLYNESTAMRTHSSYPASGYWAFGVWRIHPRTEAGQYSCLVRVKANSGRFITEEYSFNIHSAGEPTLHMAAATAVALLIVVSIPVMVPPYRKT